MKFQPCSRMRNLVPHAYNKLMVIKVRNSSLRYDIGMAFGIHIIFSKTQQNSTRPYPKFFACIIKNERTREKKKKKKVIVSSLFPSLSWTSLPLIHVAFHE